MSKWELIDTAPEDGLPVVVKRVHDDRIVAEGKAVFAHLAADAPARQPLEMDLLGRLTAADYAREAAAASAWVSSRKWLTPDRMYAFRTPTHWHPARTSLLRDSGSHPEGENGEAG